MGCTSSKDAEQNVSPSNQVPDPPIADSSASLSKPKSDAAKASGPVESSKSGTSSALASLAAAMPTITIPILQSPVYQGTSIGTIILCRDSFHSKYSGELMFKWRKAEIVNVEGSDHARVLIHFIGWADTFDQWLDLNTEIDKVAPLSLLSKAQCDSGTALDEEQLKTTRTFFLTAKFASSATGNDIVSAPTSSSSASKQLKRGNSQQSNHSNASSIEYIPGQLVDVLDIFYPVGSDIPKSKWRKAKILNVSGRILRISYIGWDSKFDENLDIVNDAERISPVGTKTTEQASRQIAENKKKSPHQATKRMVRNGTAFFTQNGAGKTEDSNGETTNESSFSSSFRRLGKSIVDAGRKHKEANGSTEVGANTNSTTTASSTGGGGGAAGNGEGGDNINENFEEETDDAIARSAEALQIELEKERRFIEALAKKGLHVIEIEGDGNCLFRAISHQLYLNEDQHEALRQQCVEHLTYHKKRFSLFCMENFEEYIKEMSKDGTWGDELEIRALEEIIDRTILIYSSESTIMDVPINTNFEEENVLKGTTPIRLAYHGLNHYNSIYSESNPLPLTKRPSSTLLQARIALFEESNKPKPPAASTTGASTTAAATTTTTKSLSRQGSKHSVIAEQQQLLLQQVQQQQQQQSGTLYQEPSQHRDPPRHQASGMNIAGSGQIVYGAQMRGYSNNAMGSVDPMQVRRQMSGHQLNGHGYVDPTRTGPAYGRGQSFGSTGLPPNGYR